MATGLRGFIETLWDKLLRYALKFGIVGLIGYFVDLAVFNFLRWGGLDGGGNFFQGPIGAKIVAVTVATVVTWIGNRYWTFREHRRKNYLREMLEFGVVAAAGMFIQLLCLWISHYVLGFRSLLADNISGNIIGLFLATAFRFLLYRYWVFAHHRSDKVADEEHAAEIAEAAIFEDDEYAAAEAEKPPLH